MKMSPKFILAFVYVTAICCAQTDAASSSVFPAKEPTVAAVQIPPPANAPAASPDPAHKAPRPVRIQLRPRGRPRLLLPQRALNCRKRGRPLQPTENRKRIPCTRPMSLEIWTCS